MPALKLQDGATLRDMTGIKLQDGATLRTISEGWIQDGATLRQVWPAVAYVPMTGSVSAVSSSYTASSGSHNIGTSNLTVSSGDPPYSKSWRASGSGFSASGSGTSAAVYCWQNTAGTYYGTVYCDVTDATSHMKTFSRSVSATVSASYVAMTGSISGVSSSFTRASSFPFYQVEVGTPIVSISGGDSPISESWAIASGPMSINSSSGLVSIFNNTAAGTYNQTVTCVFTDNTSHQITRTATASCTVNAPAYTPMTGSMADVSRSAFRPFGTQTIGVATAAISGGNPSKTYSFSLSNPGTSHFELTPAGNQCTIKQPHQSSYRTWTDTLTCVVTDGTGSKTVTCTVSFTATKT